MERSPRLGEVERRQIQPRRWRPDLEKKTAALASPGLPARGARGAWLGCRGEGGGARGHLAGARRSPQRRQSVVRPKLGFRLGKKKEEREAARVSRGGGGGFYMLERGGSGHLGARRRWMAMGSTASSFSAGGRRQRQNFGKPPGVWGNCRNLLKTSPCFEN